VEEQNKLQENINDNFKEKKERPGILSFFLIFSLINGIISAISNFMVYSMIDMVRQTFEGKESIEIMGMELNLSLFLNTNKNFFLYQGLLFIASFTGALLMWQFKKTGFHLYTLSQILLLIITTIYLPQLPFPYLDVMLTAIFVYVYAKNLRLMS
jgi:hypothetical protein